MDNNQMSGMNNTQQPVNEQPMGSNGQPQMFNGQPMGPNGISPETKKKQSIASLVTLLDV